MSWFGAKKNTKALTLKNTESLANTFAIPEPTRSLIYFTDDDENASRAFMEALTASDEGHRRAMRRVAEASIISTSMVYTQKIIEAVHFSIAVHEEDQKQKRKGKDVAYVTHPLTVALILAKAGASEAVICAGLLHDTIEDSTEENKITKEILEAEFGAEIANLVDAVTEKVRGISWHLRKEAAMEEMRHFSHDALLVKSGDVLSNNTELLRDWERDGDVTFERFNSSKEHIVSHAKQVVEILLEAWPESPLAGDLQAVKEGLEKVG